MNDTTYNGWANYETWCCKLWIDNDQGEQEYWQEQTLECAQSAIDDASADDDEETRKSEAATLLAERLASYHDDAMPEVLGMFGDLLYAAMSCIDWREIAHNMLDDEAIDWLDDSDEAA